MNQPESECEFERVSVNLAEGVSMRVSLESSRVWDGSVHQRELGVEVGEREISTMWGEILRYWKF